MRKKFNFIKVLNFDKVFLFIKIKLSCPILGKHLSKLRQTFPQSEIKLGYTFGSYEDEKKEHLITKIFNKITITDKNHCFSF